MSIASDRTALERQQRKQKIEQHLKEGSAKAEHKAAPNAKGTAKRKATRTEEPQSPLTPPSPTEVLQSVSSVPVHDSSAPNGLRYRALKPWERWEGNRVVQFRPMTRMEREAEQDAKFFASVSADDQAHKEKVRKATQEAEAWTKEDRQRQEKEERTGMRPYEPGRYISVEEAAMQGYGADDHDNE